MSHICIPCIVESHYCKDSVMRKPMYWLQKSLYKGGECIENMPMPLVTFPIMVVISLLIGFQCLFFLIISMFFPKNYIVSICSRCGKVTGVVHKKRKSAV